MEVIITLLLCALAFCLYLINRNRNEISDLKEEIRRLRTKDNNANTSLPVPDDEKIFVSVIFKENDQKYYDYFLGKNQDIKLGDFVEVYFSNKLSGKPERRVAKVIYISKPGEISEYARSVIKRKADCPKW